MITLILMAVVVSATVTWADAAPGGKGRWVLTDGVECQDTELLCVVWEFASGETTAPCCVTIFDYLSSRPFCSSYDFR